MFWRGSRQPGAGVFNKTANVAALMSLALTRSSRREEAPTNIPAIEKSLVTLAATAGQERSSPLARWYFSVACLADPDVSISTKPGQPHLMSLAHQMGEGGQRPGEGMNLGLGEGELSVSLTNQFCLEIIARPHLCPFPQERRLPMARLDFSVAALAESRCGLCY